MSIERVIGIVFSGFMCKLYAAGMAVYVAVEAATYVRTTFGAVNAAFGSM